MSVHISEALLKVTCPHFELVQIHLEAFPSFRHIAFTTQLAVICRLAEVAFDPITYVTVQNVKTLVPRQHLRHTTHHQSSPGHRAIYHSSLADLPTIPFPSNIHALNICVPKIKIRMWYETLRKTLHKSSRHHHLSISCPPMQLLYQKRPSIWSETMCHDRLWLPWITSSSLICPNMSSRRICSMIFPGTDLKLTGL